MTKAAAWEHAADGVRVNAVGPGFIMTPLLEANLDQPAIDFLASQHALQRMGRAGRGSRARRVAGQRCLLVRDRRLLPGGWRVFGPLMR